MNNFLMIYNTVMDELLDLVNENDEIIGEVWKSEANSDPKLIHREIQVYLFDENKRLLMQQRSFKKKVYPGEWVETCAGHVGKDEDPETAAHRELIEEMGFDTKLKLFCKRLVSFDKETHFSYCYFGKYLGEKIDFEKEEVEAVRLVSREELDRIYIPKDKVMVSELKWLKEVWKKWENYST